MAEPRDRNGEDLSRRLQEDDPTRGRGEDDVIGRVDEEDDEFEDEDLDEEDEDEFDESER